MAGSVNGVGFVKTQLVELLARSRRFTARHRIIASLPVLAVAVAVGFGVDEHVRALDQSRRLWLQRTSVLTMVRPVSAGSPITAGDVMLVEMPSAGAASTALGHLPDGSIALDNLATGEVLLANHLLSKRAGRLPAGTRGVSIARSDDSIAVRVGDAVQVIAVGDPGPLAGSAAPGDTPSSIADRAEVIEVSATAVIIAVDESVAPLVAQAAASNRAVLILRPD